MNKKEFLSNLSWVLNERQYETIEELVIPFDISTFLLYNTNDLCLNEEQFNALMESIGSTEKLYIAQNDSDEVYKLVFPISYNDYQSLDLFSMTYITSNNFDWLVIIDENLESGMGILAAKDEIIDNFTSRYESAIHDIQNLIAFHYRDASRNPYSMDNLIKILSLWHGKSIK